MDFDLLKDYMAVLEHGSFLAAAEAVGTSQPTLSRRIRELEDSLGVLLLNRTSRGVSPTVYGAMFKQYAEQTLRDHQSALDELRALKSGTQGHARIGMAPAFSGYLPGVISRLRSHRSGVTFEVMEGTYDSLVLKTLKGEIDGAFTMLPAGESVESLAVKLIGEEPLVVAVDANHPLRKQRDMSFDSLTAQSWVIMNRPRSIIDGFYQMLSAHGLSSPNIAIETSSLDFLKSSIRNSKLLAAIPRGAVYSELVEGSLAALDLQELPTVQVAFVHRHGVLSPLVTELVYEVEAMLRDL